MQASKRQYLEAMGIDVWVPRDVPGVVDDLTAPPPSPPFTKGGEGGFSTEAGFSRQAELPDVPDAGVAALDWPELEQRVVACTACELHTSRTQTVFGVGNHKADWMIIGEAPGADEDRQGEPFVGRAGQLLNAMLKAVDLAREQVFIANILKCRPPNNRDPRPEEAAQCEPYLMRQVDLVKPKVILAVGRISAQNLLKSTAPVGRLRGRVHRFGGQGIPLVVTYHPAYLLRSPGEKRKAWDDLRLARSVLD